MGIDKLKLTRRAFLAATTTTATVAFAQNKPNTAQVVPGKKSPNEKLNCAAARAAATSGPATRKT